MLHRAAAHHEPRHGRAQAGWSSRLLQKAQVGVVYIQQGCSRSRLTDM